MKLRTAKKIFEKYGTPKMHYSFKQFLEARRIIYKSFKSLCDCKPISLINDYDYDWEEI